MKATIKDVAKKAGVSITTVSRVLNNNYPVKQSTKEKVDRAIQELEFSPNSLARSLIQNKTSSIGVVTPSLTNSFFPIVVNGIQDYFQNAGYNIFLCDSKGDAELEASHIQRLIEHQVEGVIVIDPCTVNIKSGYYQKISGRIPVVLVNGYHKDIPLNFVINNQEIGAYEALMYLYSLGHRYIAFLRGEKSYSYDLKEDVYRQFLTEHHIQVNPEYILTVANGNSTETVDLSVQAFKALFSKPERPTAVFACNDWMAVGCLHGANHLGLNVPEDISIVGFDNIIISQLSMPSLTTVDQNMNRLGQTSAACLFANIEDKHARPETIFLDTKLVKRASCGPVKIIN